jgi:hypothetical protein
MKLIKEIICLELLFALTTNLVFGQVQIDSFIKIQLDFDSIGQLMESQLDMGLDEYETGVRERGDNLKEGIFRRRDRIPVTPNCVEESSEKERVRCTEKFLSAFLVKYIDSLEIKGSTDIHKLISCRVTIDYVGKMTNIEVLNAVDENISSEIISTIDLLRKNDVYWTAQNSNTRIRSIFVYMTINLNKLMNLKED